MEPSPFNSPPEVIGAGFGDGGFDHVARFQVCCAIQIDVAIDFWAVKKGDTIKKGTQYQLGGTTMADDDLISIASPFYTVLLQRGDGDDGDFEVHLVSPDSNPLHRLYADFYSAPTSRRLLYGKPYAAWSALFHLTGVM